MMVKCHALSPQENLNEFDEKSLSVLASCLEHLESSPNGDALKEGVRWVPVTSVLTAAVILQK